MTRLLPRLAGAALLLAAACGRDAPPPPPTTLAKESARLQGKLDPRCFSLPLDVKEPVLLEGSEVSYSLQALATGAEGRVSAACTVTDEGRVDGCEIVKSGGPALDGPVLAALRSRRYCPATRDGWPVPFPKRFDFRFKLTDDAPVRP
jgi:TonB family protein